MSRIIERLREAGRSRQEPEDTSAGPETVLGKAVLSSAAKNSQMIVTPRLLAMVLGCWLISLVLAIIAAVYGGMSQRAVLGDIKTVVRKQSLRIQTMEKALRESETRQGKARQGLSEQIKGLDSKLVKAERRVEAVSSAYATLGKDLERLQYSSQGLFDKYLNLSSEIKSLRLMTAPDSAAIIKSGRSVYGKNN